MKKLVLIFAVVCVLASHKGNCQATVFTVLKDPLKLASQYYGEGNYAEAIELLQYHLARNPNHPTTRLKLAQSYYHVKNYQKAVFYYDSYLRQDEKVLSWMDMFFYAEGQVSLGNQAIAIDYYKQCLQREPNNELIEKKIWQLKNITYLYEDSAHYAVRPIEINTNFGDLCALSYKNGIVFSSNRKGVKAIEQVNAKLNTPFYELYQASWKVDSTVRSGYALDDPTSFAGVIKSPYNTGPMAFYNGGQNMVFVSSSDKVNGGGVDRTLGLYFASTEDGKWKRVSSFPYNSDYFSITDVTISEDGRKIFFSSDMKGGVGGKDIYSSLLIDGQWSKPTNLGESVNTSQNEVFPFLHRDGSLYFSSDGHAGIGQLDIFKVELKSDGYSEPQNLGYPLNSGYDDFGISFDSVATHGYMSSNRKNGGYDDDIFEFDMDLQKYPITLAGVMKFKEHTWSDKSAIQLWPKVKIFLVDSWSGKRVYECVTDDGGNFSVIIPYFGKYYLQIVEQSGDEHKASLEIGKYRSEISKHEIVVVKDIFK